jgi:fatty acid desaturase
MKKSDLPEWLFTRRGGVSTLRITAIWSSFFFIVALVVKTDNVLLVMVCFLLIGILHYHMNILGHEGIHYSLYKNRRLNDFVCRWLIHASHCAPLTKLRRNHLNHHARLGQKSDADQQYYDLSSMHRGRELLIWLAGSFFGAMTIQVVFKLLRRSEAEKKQSNSQQSVTDVVSILIVQLLILIMFYAVGGDFIDYLVFWIAPILTVMFGLNVVRSCLEHAVITDFNVEKPDRLVSFKSNPIELFLLSPYNMNFHAEHHLWPSVPCSNLPCLADALRHGASKIAVYPSYSGRLLEIVSLLNHRSKKV